jgi:hypothetical protein
VAQAAISVLEANSSLRRNFETWFSTVRSERWRSEATWRLESPRDTIAVTLPSRAVRVDDCLIAEG